VKLPRAQPGGTQVGTPGISGGGSEPISVPPHLALDWANFAALPNQLGTQLALSLGTACISNPE